jgi:predicted porin
LLFRLKASTLSLVVVLTTLTEVICFILFLTRREFMNLKRTAIAMAVAGITAAAPMIASADGSIYGNIRYGISSADAGGASERVTQVQNFGSRYGMKGETDLGNGMTAFGHWEDGMVPRSDGNVRDIKVGLRGDFGEAYIGDAINHAWDAYMSTDSTWWFGGTQKLTDGIQKGVTYMGAAGPVSFGVSAAMDSQGAANNANEEAIDAIEIVVGFDAGPVNIAVGMSDAKTSPVDTEAVMGFVIKGDAGGFGYAVDFQSQGAPTGSTADRTSFQLQGTYGNFIAQYGVINTDGVGNEASPTNLTLTYTQNLGPATLVYYEFRSLDADTPTSDAATVLAAVLKYNIM